VAIKLITTLHKWQFRWSLNWSIFLLLFCLRMNPVQVIHIHTMEQKYETETGFLLWCCFAVFQIFTNCIILHFSEVFGSFVLKSFKICWRWNWQSLCAVFIALRWRNKQRCMEYFSQIIITFSRLKTTNVLTCKCFKLELILSYVKPMK